MKIGNTQGSFLTLDGGNSVIKSLNDNSLTLDTTTSGVLNVLAGNISVSNGGAAVTFTAVNTTLDIVGNTISLVTNGGNVVVELANSPTSYVDVAGITAAEYVANIAAVDTALVNKLYVDQAIANGAEKGAIKAIKFSAIASVDTTSTILMPAFSTVLSVKVQVITAGAGQNVVVGSVTSPSLYMTNDGTDENSVGLYVTETYVTTGATPEAVVLSFLPTGIDASGPTVNVIVEYQVAQ